MGLLNGLLSVAVGVVVSPIAAASDLFNEDFDMPRTRRVVGRTVHRAAKLPAGHGGHQ